jgi:hypothetical protein
MPGLTCNSAVWSKILYCDLTRQTLTKGMLTDYDATAAFDRILHALAVITCRRIGLPHSAGLFIYNLLHNMEFHLITGYGKSCNHFRNNADIDQPGQGMLQGSSSAAPIYNFTSDVSLSAYQSIAKGATFNHPCTDRPLTIHATQNVDDKAATVNEMGLQQPLTNQSNSVRREKIFEQANKNDNTWAQLL